MKLTLAPALDGAFSVNWYAAIGPMLAPTVTNWFDEPASNVNAVGAVRNKKRSAAAAVVGWALAAEI